MNYAGINEFNYNASRSACIIMTPLCDTKFEYNGNNGTLINFPYRDCNNPDECNNSFVISVAHNAEVIKIFDADVSGDETYLNRVLIRFNWHHEFGTPWHLKSIPCDNFQNFQLWRSTINFDDVIDYCGVSVFAFADNEPDKGDFIILKMKQKPFFKEHHLGWTEQRFFDFDTLRVSDNTNKYTILDSARFSIIGRRSKKPTGIFKNYSCDYFYSPHEVVNFKTNTINLKIYLRDTINKTDMIYQPKDFSGYSGSQLTYQDYLDPNQRIGLGLLKSATIDSNGYVNHVYFSSRTYSNIFEYWNDITILEPCYSNYKSINSYINSEVSDLYLTKNYTYKENGVLKYDTSIWMPSLDNKQRCPSKIFINDTCKFNINDYVVWDPVSRCLSFTKIPKNLFPGAEMPKGYRLYLNYGEQKTIYFDPFNDKLPIDSIKGYCFSKCELFELFMQNQDSISLAIDFYDEHGRVLNNIGCQKNELKLPIDIDFCSLLEIKSVKTLLNSTCCRYKFFITFKDSCTKNRPFMHKIASVLKLLNSPQDSGTYILKLDGYSVNSGNDTISFTKTLCDSSSNTRFIFAYKDGKLLCNNFELRPALCGCRCPDQDLAKNWVSVSISPGGPGSSCSEGYCVVTYDIDVPPFFDCYRFCKIGEINMSLSSGKASYSLCIPAGTVRIDTIRIKKTLSDSNACVIFKNSYCPTTVTSKFCSSGCDTVPWIERNIGFYHPKYPRCYIKSKYLTRVNTCIDKQELQVIKIEFKDSITCDSCMMDMAGVHKQIILRAIFQNDMGFKPKIEDVRDSLCDESWRVSIASCWASVSSPFEIVNGDWENTNKVSYVPCDTICCSIGLQVCRYYGPPQYIKINKIISSDSSTICFGDSLFVHDPHIVRSGDPFTHGDDYSYYIVEGYYVPCINRCDWLSILNSDPYPKKKVMEYVPNNNIILRNDCRLLTYINSNVLNCMLESDIASDNFSISIYSMNGELLLKDKRKVERGINDFSIDLNQLLSGVYLIHAEIDGICSKIDKLIILK